MSYKRFSPSISEAILKRNREGLRSLAFVSAAVFGACAVLSTAGGATIFGTILIGFFIVMYADYRRTRRRLLNGDFGDEECATEARHVALVAAEIKAAG